MTGGDWVEELARLAVLDFNEAYGVEGGTTLSNTIRGLLPLDTTAGKVKLAVAIATGGAVLYFHLVDPEKVAALKAALA